MSNLISFYYFKQQNQSEVNPDQTSATSSAAAQGKSTSGPEVDREQSSDMPNETKQGNDGSIAWTKNNVEFGNVIPGKVGT